MDFKNVGLPITVTKNELLSKITAEEIYYRYFGKFTLKKTYSSPLREDKKPSFGFYYNTNGELISNDITTKEKLDCITFVSRLYKITYYEAIKLICNDFNICKDPNINSILTKESILQKSSLFSDDLKKKTVIQIVKKEFSEEELEYWQSKNKNITKQELEENNVFAIKELYINKSLVYHRKNELRFALYQKDPKTGKGYFKIYQPNSEKYKWVSNIALSLPFGIDNLPFLSSTLIITKSQKDRIILKRLFTDVIATQNESTAAIERCLEIAKIYDKVVLLWDSDEPGVRACQEVTAQYGWKYFNTPKYLYEEKGITDITEYVENFGMKSLERRLKEKRIL